MDSRVSGSTRKVPAQVAEERARFDQIGFEYGPEWLKENVNLPEADAHGDIHLPPIEFPEWALGEDGQTHGRQQQS